MPLSCRMGSPAFTKVEAEVSLDSFVASENERPFCIVGVVGVVG